MFFSLKVKYNSKPVVPKYPAVEAVYEWQKVKPNTEGLSAEQISFIVSKWQYKQVKRDFQKEINSQYVITPKMIATGSQVPNTQNVVYQKVPLNNLNATDIRQGSKAIADSFISKQANDMATAQVKQFVNSKKLSDPYTTINQLKKQNEELQAKLNQSKGVK